MKQIHLHLPLLIGVAASTAWLQSYLARWIGARLLHSANMCAMCAWCLILFFYCQSYAVVTGCMAGIGLSYGMLHVYFLSTVVSRVNRYFTCFGNSVNLKNSRSWNSGYDAQFLQELIKICHICEK
jgi:ACR3 family arsenite efflux pump ArsB